MIRKEVLRTNENEWCALQVELRDRTGQGPELSICGSAGYVLTEEQARKEALEYWESYFEDEPEQRKAMQTRFGKRFRTARAAARFVLATDGEYHGLDVYKEEDGKVYVTTSCGQIREELTRYFPEAIPFFPWHLNHFSGFGINSEGPRGELPGEVIAWVESL